MHTTDIVLLLVGIGVIGFIAWFFLGSKKSAAAPQEGDSQHVTVVVRGGYNPAVITLKKYMPSTAGSQIRSHLPASVRTDIQYTPTLEGIYDFAYGTGMLYGKVVVTT